MAERSTAVVNGALQEAFRHNAWATRELLEFCRSLPAEQLTTPGVGTYGGVLETFNHLILAEARYLRRLAGSAPAWVDEGGNDPGDVDPKKIRIDELRSRADETEKRWETLLVGPVDSERVILLDEGAYQVHAGVLVAQALHHGNAHREQICAMLTGSGLQPPDVQAWAYAEATGRGGPRNRA
ncbi:MAG TPA: DinB family protein [Candidatus Limnocylindrales bacterium]|nr:DinB family protein [Candidatus Limnocylindrales bacterium]